MTTTQVNDTYGPTDAAPARRVPMALVTWAFVLIVMLIVVVLLVVKVTRGSTIVHPPPVAAAPAAVVREATSVPPAVYDAVGAPELEAPGAVALTGQPPVTVGGRPAVVYVGAEFCPYCAAQRWALVTALGRFGTFSHLGATSSSTNEVFPATPTFSFDGSSFRSPYVAFVPVEEYGATAASTAPAGFPALHPPNPLQWALLRRYDEAPYVPGSGTLPFVDVDNRLVVSGAGVGFSPGLLQGVSMGQIATDLSESSNAVTQAVLGEANTLSAAICAADGELPSTVCRSAGVLAGARRLASG
jgi:hypothetical protein